jgi:transposase
MGYIVLMKDKPTDIEAVNQAEQEAQRKALCDLLETQKINKRKLAKLLGVRSRGTIYPWLASPDEGGKAMPGPVWRWVQLLTERPEMISWLERQEGGGLKGRKQLSARQQLDNIEAAIVEDILATPDEELLSEIRENGGDPEATAAQCQKIFGKVKDNV